MEIRELVSMAYNNARKKGFYDNYKPFERHLLDVRKEVDEVIDAIFNGKYSPQFQYNPELFFLPIDNDPRKKTIYETYVKNTVEDELADIVILVASLCGYKGINLERHIKIKMAYNLTRPRLHRREQ